MRSDSDRLPPVPQKARPPSDRATPPLRDDDVVEEESLRGRVVRVGAEIVAAVWED
jgi:hypothetical protein